MKALKRLFLLSLCSVLFATLATSCETELESIATDIKNNSSTTTVVGNSPSPTDFLFPGGNTQIVERIIDGDTFVTSTNERIRLIGVNTPEIEKKNDPDSVAQCFGPEATKWLNQTIPPGSAVRIEHEADHKDYVGRTLGHVYKLSNDPSQPDLYINAELLKQGFAETMFRGKNVAKRPEFKQLEQEAKSAGIGRWGACK